MMKKVLWPVLFLVAGFFLGYLWSSGSFSGNLSSDNSNASSTAEGEVLEGGGAYSFINPLLECNLGADYISKNAIAPFSSTIKPVIDQETSKGDISYAAFYFRDLNNGSYFGINQNDNFRPASLLKVPLLMSFLNKEENVPGTLDKVVTYDGTDLNAVQNIKPAKQVMAGKKYTVWELLGYMIKYSDNKATSQLLELTDNNRLNDFYKILGIDLPTSGGSEAFISLKSYASFFRILFNSSYATNALSERGLKLLSEADFQGGIRGVIPASVPVAHKFGELTDSTTHTYQLHDCGIVYYPKKPFLICVSVKGTDFSKMEKSIEALAKTTYDEVDRQVKAQ